MLVKVATLIYRILNLKLAIGIPIMFKFDIDKHSEPLG